MMQQGDTVYAARDIRLQEVFNTINVEENSVVVAKGASGTVSDVLDDGRVWVQFEDDEWCCEQNMLFTVPRIRKLYREALITDHVDVFFVDKDGRNLGEIDFHWHQGVATVHFPSLDVLYMARDIFESNIEPQISITDFVKHLDTLGYRSNEFEEGDAVTPFTAITLSDGSVYVNAEPGAEFTVMKVCVDETMVISDDSDGTTYIVSKCDFDHVPD
jgi:hypothetical protein